MTSPTRSLHELGQSLWLDNITRGMLDDGSIRRYVEEYSVTGLTSNPSIFDKAVEGGGYDEAIAAKSADGASGEDLFFELAIEDLRRAADLFATAHAATAGMDGYVSLEVSPELAYDTAATVAAAKALHTRAGRDNLFIKIPGTPEGLPAITESITAGVPVNVTLLFDAQQYRAAAEAYMAGVEQRLAAGDDPVVTSVASVFMSRWDAAVAGEVPEALTNRLALAIGGATYRTYRELLASQRWQDLEAKGARPQRLLWASTSTKDPDAPDTMYVSGLVAPDTINTMPDSTLEAFHDHGELGGVMDPDGGGCDEELARFAEAGVDVAALAERLQSDGAEAFVKSWRALMERIEGHARAVA
ncbi:MAG: transaldolase [Microthrixaceae bacterium]|nr:transaldolase [Microthrixaceae bacterium]